MITLERPQVASADTGTAPTTEQDTALLTVAVPIYNERETLLEIVRQVRGAALPDGVGREIILVDDGSTDGTRELLQTEVEGRFADVRVLYHPENRGKGAGIISAIAAARGDYLVVQDADLEYDPNEFGLLLAPMLAGNADVVYGSRFTGKIEGMKGANLVANRILTTVANILFPGARITDEATCYKMFRVSVLRSFPLRAQRFDFCPEVTAKVLKRGIRIHEIPIHYRARTELQGKKIRWTDGVEALWTLIKYRFID
ncbi:MAG: glycosyltransferase family 2 protein [Fibrella sp.]|nr:glycosyltransferase family 2 protein [Armatimonadota bacterium]